MTTWFGSAVDTAGITYGSTGELAGQAFAAPASGNITAARLKAKARAGEPQSKIKIAIYAVSGSAPAALLGISNEVTLPGGGATAIHDFTFGTPIPVVSGTSYFLMLFASLGMSEVRKTNGGTTYYKSGAGAPPNPFGTPTGTYAGERPYLEAGIEPATAPPVANFTGTPLSGTAPLSVAFTDTSTNMPTSWAWTFGDGGTSTAQNPTHNYTTPGTYTVTLTATNADGSDAETKTAYVTVAAVPPIADFDASPLSGEMPLLVCNFDDESTNTPTSWAWDFGDGASSTSQNPSHTYTAPGTYTVELVATNAGGSDTETKTDYVTVTAVQPEGISIAFGDPMLEPFPTWTRLDS